MGYWLHLRSHMEERVGVRDTVDTRYPSVTHPLFPLTSPTRYPLPGEGDFGLNSKRVPLIVN